MDITKIDDLDLIEELLSRGYTISREKKKKNLKQVKEEADLKFKNPTPHTDNTNGDRPFGIFASSQEIENRARMGADVLFSGLNNAFRKKEKKNKEEEE
jgi:hypothetical protein